MLRKALGLFPPIPFLLSPRTDYEARYGKPVLLTDCELGVIISALGNHRLCKEDEEAIADLFPKLLDALGEDAPYERQVSLPPGE